MSIRDRNLKKWQGAFFMPEHIKMLKNYWEEDKKQSKPQLDEHSIEIINQNLAKSLQELLPLRFELYKNGFIEELTGIVQQVDVLQRRIKVIDEKEYVQFIKFDDLVGTEPI